MAPDYEETREMGIAALWKGFSTLLTSEEFADLKVKLGDRTWNVHKVVVCCRSDFFAKARKGEFKVGQPARMDRPRTTHTDRDHRMHQEGKEGIVELHDDDPDVIDKMFHYIYRNEYDDADTETAPSSSTKLEYDVENTWATTPFADAIDEAYTMTADSDHLLRDALLGVVNKHADELFDEDQTRYPHFQAMAAKTPSFSMEVAGLLVMAEGERRRRKVTYRCPGSSCPMVFASTMKESDQPVARTCGRCTFAAKCTWAIWQQYRTVVDEKVVEGA
ncbi:hypothetical protein B0A55_01411 [Friedmanniomyces simplex]|uniref:BTB domain-containing protein n=1 Tax=Friedmanniomyces simplex TaxID=329884 RepID=A0A4U0XX53_9PEZI|nr:hypothetical protein B0A55_01411 [Friedmanniomyces simplex]